MEQINHFHTQSELGIGSNVAKWRSQKLVGFARSNNIMSGFWTRSCAKTHNRHQKDTEYKAVVARSTHIQQSEIRDCDNFLMRGKHKLGGRRRAIPDTNKLVKNLIPKGDIK